MFEGGSPPGPRAGDISPVTEALRPRVGLSEKECSKARRLRRAGWTVAQITEHLELTQEEVRHALATLRTRNEEATRRSLNVTIEAAEFVAGEADGDEACWEVVDRLLVELAFSRAMLGAAVTRHGGR